MKVNIGRYPKSNTERKISVKIEKHDTWSLDTTLAHIIYPALLKLKAEKQGTPFVEIEDAPHIVRTKGEFTNYDYSSEAWDYVLNEMIWAMQQIKDDEPDVHCFYEQHPPDFDSIHKYHKRLQNGCRLFGVYFQALWT